MPKIAKRALHSIPRATFTRTVRFIGSTVNPDIKWSTGALAALQDDAEQLLVKRFERAGGLLSEFKHKTVGARHFQIAGR